MRGSAPTGAGRVEIDCCAAAGTAAASNKAAARIGRFMANRLSREGGQVTRANRSNSRVGRSKQPHLSALGRAEQVGAERELGLAQTIFLAGDLEAGAKEVGPRALPAHPAEEIGI